MAIKKNCLHPLKSSRIRARAEGYDFALTEERWVLDKNVTVDVGHVAALLNDTTRGGFLSALADFASKYSASYTKNIVGRLYHLLRQTGSSEITDVTLINYRSSLRNTNEWYVGHIRSFLREWYERGYAGIDEALITMLDGWRLKGNRKGDAVKRKDPRRGAFTDIELEAFNEGAVRCYEKGLITVRELAICVIASNTGRRPVQISHLRVADVASGRNSKNEPFHILNIPRAKQGSDFRVSFKSFAMPHELWAILHSQARNAIRLVENRLGFALQDADRMQVPLFPDLDVAGTIASPQHFRQIVRTDKLHMTSAEVTSTLHHVAAAADIRSERTGDLLHSNAQRFRYTIGTRAAREGFGVMVIAELLDHSDNQNAKSYVENVPEHVERLDEAVGFQLAPYAQAFAGVLVDSEEHARRGADSSSRIRSEEGKSVGTCGEHGFCGANVPIPCYTCMHFQPWVEGPHEDVYRSLLEERERIKKITGDIQIAAVLDRSIIAVAEVIQRCAARRGRSSQIMADTHG
ncbi:site-specific integrase [Pseudomonas sp. OIL-1]|uniref:site-specific integrase n=1 Tax=Pseudomonas sp. OIL-1 TaxID=2706126 RepID=UPI0013A71ECC|nr:site-specific integrase [Pseudomonas sp. OIL-1]QIB50725.1 recombinase [Pseudomonas sp. OIL-1]